jgi:hypothetical protein
MGVSKMERKFKIYQRRDGFQIAEESTGIRLENGMEFLVRPNKSAFWCLAAFNIVIDDDYALVGEEVIDCSRRPAQVICFVDGVMLAIDQSRIDVEDMIEQCDDAISDRNIPAALAWKVDIDAAIEHCHAEALEMDSEYQQAIATIAENLTLPVWDRCSGTVKTEIVKHHHAEALEMNKKCSELYYRYWRWWNVMDEYCRADDFACAHKTALKMDAEINGKAA